MTAAKINVVEASGPVGGFGWGCAPCSYYLRVAAGEFQGFLGPNGVGKSAALSVLPGTSRSTAGTVRMFWLDRWADAVGTRQDSAVLRPAVAPRRAGSRRHGPVR